MNHWVCQYGAPLYLLFRSPANMSNIIKNSLLGIGIEKMVEPASISHNGFAVNYWIQTRNDSIEKVSVSILVSLVEGKHSYLGLCDSEKIILKEFIRTLNKLLLTLFDEAAVSLEIENNRDIQRLSTSMTTKDRVDSNIIIKTNQQYDPYSNQDMFE